MVVGREVVIIARRKKGGRGGLVHSKSLIDICFKRRAEEGQKEEGFGVGSCL